MDWPPDYVANERFGLLCAQVTEGQPNCVAKDHARGGDLLRILGIIPTKCD